MAGTTGGPASSASQVGLHCFKVGHDQLFVYLFFTPICLFLFQAAAVTGSGAKICDNEKSKIGHRRVNERGEITFKKVTTDHLMGSIQLGL